MKRAEMKGIVRAIGSSAPHLYEKGRLLVTTPRGRILRGFYLEDSSDPTRVYLWAFVQPLYTPSSTVVFDFGKRLGSASKTWSVDDGEEVAAIVREEAVPFLDAVSSPETFARWSFLKGRVDAHTDEAKAYSLLAAGRFSEGAQALRTLAGSLSDQTPWMIEMRKRAVHLAALAETNPTAADERLATWEAETVSTLGLQDVPPS